MAANSSSTVDVEVSTRVPCSGSSPAARGSGVSRHVLGRTMTVRVSRNRWLDRTSPNGSSTSTVSGPTGCSPRRCVGKE